MKFTVDVRPSPKALYTLQVVSKAGDFLEGDVIDDKVIITRVHFDLTDPGEFLELFACFVLTHQEYTPRIKEEKAQRNQARSEYGNKY